MSAQLANATEAATAGELNCAIAARSCAGDASTQEHLLQLIGHSSAPSVSAQLTKVRPQPPLDATISHALLVLAKAHPSTGVGDAG
jgi:hypothetical protein